MSDRSLALVATIGREFRRRLIGEQLPRIVLCAEKLGEQAIWQRPGPTGNSVGNLILHLCGNTRQWIITEFRGEPDTRQRDAEFAADGGASVAELSAQLEAVYREACSVVDSLETDEFLAERRIQGYDENGLSAVLHVLEHTSGHAGQIYAWTKQVLGTDLAFYDL
ncbi:MAG: DinB family protein [Planctomycetota bacterium]